MAGATLATAAPVALSAARVVVVPALRTGPVPWPHVGACSCSCLRHHHHPLAPAEAPVATIHHHRPWLRRLAPVADLALGVVVVPAIGAEPVASAGVLAGRRRSRSLAPIADLAVRVVMVVARGAGPIALSHVHTGLDFHRVRPS
eukprot:CAMPEP_0180757680 /NCGR_PEP_ID=MMETSP1038_2-20121128/34890_1 /TAXON_ID=632150 /ORGANISM="Azadinium spinosum, Strain 3D9" /LENGTH=144 /DNA_ID=CAMNT_0022791739 /DNA_START=358 /DNA_END=788 /DNA_ORIENTATION=-